MSPLQKHTWAMNLTRTSLLSLLSLLAGLPNDCNSLSRRPDTSFFWIVLDRNRSLMLGWAKIKSRMPHAWPWGTFHWSICVTTSPVNCTMLNLWYCLIDSIMFLMSEISFEKLLSGSFSKAICLDSFFSYSKGFFPPPVLSAVAPAVPLVLKLNILPCSWGKARVEFGLWVYSNDCCLCSEFFDCCCFWSNCFFPADGLFCASVNWANRLFVFLVDCGSDVFACYCLAEPMTGFEPNAHSSLDCSYDLKPDCFCLSVDSTIDENVLWWRECSRIFQKFWLNYY